MKKALFSQPIRSASYLVIVLLSLALLAFVTLWSSSTEVKALPEYSPRTGAACAACHVSAGGGGPRTLRGLLWGARGRPDKVPELPGMLIAPHVEDAVELYQIACGGCHGYKGEGLSAAGLTNTKIGYTSILSFTVRGIKPLGMPAFEGQFTDEQLETLVSYVTGLANGSIPPPSDTYALPPSLFRCDAATSESAFCNDTPPEIGGN